MNIGETGHSTATLEDSLESHRTFSQLVVTYNRVGTIDLHFSTVVEESIGYNGGIGCKEPEVDGDITGRHVGWGVCFVHLLIENTSVVGDVEDIVSLAESVERSVSAVNYIALLGFDVLTS